MLVIESLALCLPDEAEHRSLLGTVIGEAYRHLGTPAGRHSQPPSVRAGLRIQHSSPYRVPTAAGRRSSELASLALGTLLQDGAEQRSSFDLHIHAQCALDHWIQSSPCMKLVHEHLPGIGQSFALGQLGTAALPTALELLWRGTARRSCITASDVWIAPFVRRAPGVLTFADASAAAVVRRDDGRQRGIARVEALATICEPPRADPFSGPAPAARAWLLGLSCHVVMTLLEKLGAADRAGLNIIGDGLEGAFDAEVAQAAGLSPLRQTYAPGIHLGSAGPLFAIAQAVQARGAGRDQPRTIVWSVSPSGHAGALLVHTTPALTQARSNGCTFITHS